jgi:hypothetical protein
MPPVRLRDDPAATPSLRAELGRAGSAGISSYDVAAGLARFEAALPPPVPAAAGPGLLGAALKGAVVGVAVVGVAGAMSLAPSGAAPPVVPTAVPAGPATGVAVATGAPEVVPGPPPAVPDDPRPAPVAPPRRALPTHQDGPAARPARSDERAEDAGAAPRPLSHTDALALEMENLGQLRTLASSDPVAALALATEGQQRFPTGVFVEEREAIAVGALVRLGRAAEARARAEAFLAAHPRSAFAERLRALTGAGEGSPPPRP